MVFSAKKLFSIAAKYKDKYLYQVLDVSGVFIYDVEIENGRILSKDEPVWCDVVEFEDIDGNSLQRFAESEDSSLLIIGPGDEENPCMADLYIEGKYIGTIYGTDVVQITSKVVLKYMYRVLGISDVERFNIWNKYAEGFAGYDIVFYDNEGLEYLGFPWTRNSSKLRYIRNGTLHEYIIRSILDGENIPYVDISLDKNTEDKDVLEMHVCPVNSSEEPITTQNIQDVLNKIQSVFTGT